MLSLFLSLSYAAPTIADAPANHAAEPYQAGDCDIGGNTPCVWNSSTKTVTCDLSQFSCVRVDAWSVHWVGTNSDQYAVFGSCETLSGSDDFACEVTDGSDEIENTLLIGTSGADFLSHQWENPSFDMRSTNGNTPFTIQIKGGDSGDTIVGSGTTVDNVVEKLWGEGGSDTMDGHAGLLDHLYGGGGNDTLDGGFGEDWIHGGNGTDTLTGGPGRNWLHGGNGNGDVLTGDSYYDVLYGGIGSGDILTAGSGDDVLCENSIPLPGGACPTGHVFDGGLDDDRASVALHWACGGGTVDINAGGTNSIEEPYDTAIDWSAVSTATPLSVQTHGYPQECVDIVAWGGW